jgi:hypothetical protein
MSLKLYEIADQFRALERLEGSEEIPPEVMADTLEALDGDFEVKAIAVAKFILSLEAAAGDIQEAAKAMKARADRLSRRAEGVRAYLLFNFQSLNKKKLESPELTIARRSNPVSVQVTYSESIPQKFWVQPEPPPPHIDKRALKDALQSGEEIVGAYLESGESLRISL